MEKINLNKVLKDLELSYITQALLATNNNIANAANLLGLKRTTLRMRLNSLGILVKQKEEVSKQILISTNNVEDQLW